MAPVVEMYGDLFAMPTSLAHAVSEEFHQGAGIAVGFKEYFGRVDELLAQGRRVGEVAYLKHKETYIFYLITKKNYWERVVLLSSVLSCLFHLRELSLSLGVTELSMPKIGCGLDLLKFEDVLPRILSAFHDCPVKVNVVSPPPQVRGMAVAGDSQGLRFLLARGKLPRCISRTPYPRTAGLCGFGWTITRLLQLLNDMPDNSLHDVLVLIGTNNVLEMCAAEPSKARQLLRKCRGLCNALRTTLSMKVKACCRAVVTTVPPLPKILCPKDGDSGRAHYFWSNFNKALLSLTENRFHVVDLGKHFTTDGVIREDLFERFMGRNNREDRIHINLKGMRVLEKVILAVPPFTP
ncbi:ADP-ribose glycohydrolase OARD1 [Frankliniella fusca]|uniref:ADP-ribose glycohydrolase OARD1 n=1 Tax=Frankliniella fusca TaxID=407009 RepID=A0AAE1H9Z7_9NEOP|nr:ADP-ribose glycohydrolase OARD1 [Frankliniella fusca]